ncbi:hypothetical protein ACFL4A_04865, partial [bacterium]
SIKGSLNALEGQYKIIESQIHKLMSDKWLDVDVAELQKLLAEFTREKESLEDRINKVLLAGQASFFNERIKDIKNTITEIGNIESAARNQINKAEKKLLGLTHKKVPIRIESIDNVLCEMSVPFEYVLRTRWKDKKNSVKGSYISGSSFCFGSLTGTNSKLLEAIQTKINPRQKEKKELLANQSELSKQKIIQIKKKYIDSCKSRNMTSDEEKQLEYLISRLQTRGCNIVIFDNKQINDLIMQCEKGTTTLYISVTMLRRLVDCANGQNTAYRRFVDEIIRKLELLLFFQTEVIISPETAKKQIPLGFLLNNLGKVEGVSTQVNILGSAAYQYLFEDFKEWKNVNDVDIAVYIPGFDNNGDFHNFIEKNIASLLPFSGCWKLIFPIREDLKKSLSIKGYAITLTRLDTGKQLKIDVVFSKEAQSPADNFEAQMRDVSTLDEIILSFLCLPVWYLFQQTQEGVLIPNRTNSHGNIFRASLKVVKGLAHYISIKKLTEGVLLHAPISDDKWKFKNDFDMDKLSDDINLKKLFLFLWQYFKYMGGTKHVYERKACAFVIKLQKFVKSHGQREDLASTVCDLLYMGCYYVYQLINENKQILPTDMICIADVRKNIEKYTISEPVMEETNSIKEQLLILLYFIQERLKQTKEQLTPLQSGILELKGTQDDFMIKSLEALANILQRECQEQKGQIQAVPSPKEEEDEIVIHDGDFICKYFHCGEERGRNIIVKQFFKDSVLEREIFFTVDGVMGAVLKAEEYDYKKQAMCIFRKENNMPIHLFLQNILKPIMTESKYRRLAADIFDASKSCDIAVVAKSLFEETEVLMHLKQKDDKAAKELKNMLKNMLIKRMEAEYRFLCYPENFQKNIEKTTKEFERLLKVISNAYQSEFDFESEIIVEIVKQISPENIFIQVLNQIAQNIERGLVFYLLNMQNPKKLLNFICDTIFKDTRIQIDAKEETLIVDITAFEKMKQAV